MLEYKSRKLQRYLDSAQETCGSAARQLQHRLQDETLREMDVQGIGTLAQAFAATFSIPSDVTKMRLMTQVRSATTVSFGSPRPSKEWENVCKNLQGRRENISEGDCPRHPA